MYYLGEDKLIEIFCKVDDFTKEIGELFKQRSLQAKLPYRQPTRTCQLAASEMMTLLIYYHLSGYKCFKYYYQRLVRHGALKSYFPAAPSYNRFIELIPRQVLGLFILAKMACHRSDEDEHRFIDSKKLVVCHNLRIHSHKVFEGIAKRGKSSTGWFFGFKLHLIINTLGEIVNFDITPDNVADNNQELLKRLCKDLQGYLYGDKGYLSKLFEHFFKQGLQLITKVRKNMKQKLMPLQQRLMLKKRALIESVNDILCHICNIEHSRHRNPVNAFAHILSGLIAYQFLDDKPSIHKAKKLHAYIPKID